MDDCEGLLRETARRAGTFPRLGPAGDEVTVNTPFERITVKEAFHRYAGLKRPPAEDDDLFFRTFLNRVEPRLGRDRPTVLTEYPAQMAALARLKPGDPTVAERFELYAGGLELANAFSELNDADEQRRRFLAEQEKRRAIGRPVYPLDEAFLSDLERMPPAAGIALGIDRLVMLAAGADSIGQVVAFPEEPMS
jgi:lysyl-tRNA synthetase class 2